MREAALPMPCRRRGHSALPALVLAGLAASAHAAPPAAPPAALPAAPSSATSATTHTNPLPLRLADGSLAESCADPSLLRDRATASPTWYMYCTMDPVSYRERDDTGWTFRMMPVYRSVDLVNWYFLRDSCEQRPGAIASPKSGLWAPEPV